MYRLIDFVAVFLILASPVQVAPIRTFDTTAPDMPLPEAIQAMQATVQSASTQGSNVDLDELQRLLNIVASELERLREANHDGRPPSTSLTRAQVQDEDGGNDSNGTVVDANFYNITCKGVSVCNPVTIYNGRGAKKMDLEKAARKAQKRRKKGSWWRRGKSGRWQEQN